MLDMPAPSAHDLATGTEAVVAESLEVRLARLEERTALKPKTLMDHVKEWAGVGTAVIALLYTVPLGVWDRWVLDPGTQRLEALRSGILQMADFEARGAQGFASITDPLAKNIYGSAMNSQRAAVLARVEPLIRTTARQSLSVAELLMLGYNLGQAGQNALAAEVYASAVEVAARTEAPIAMQAEVHRLTGQFNGMRLENPSIEAARQGYSQSFQILLRANSFPAKLQAAGVAYEWALVELVVPGGDWGCGQQLRQWANQQMPHLMAVNPASQSIALNFEPRLRALQQRPGQPAQGCTGPVAALLRAS